MRIQVVQLDGEMLIIEFSIEIVHFLKHFYMFGIEGGEAVVKPRTLIVFSFGPCSNEILIISPYVWGRTPPPPSKICYPGEAILSKFLFGREVLKFWIFWIIHFSSIWCREGGGKGGVQSSIRWQFSSGPSRTHLRRFQPYTRTKLFIVGHPVDAELPCPCCVFNR